MESAGARVVPISYNANQSHLDFLFASLDGFLFPGGHFPETAHYIFGRTAVAANDRRECSPLCLGSSAPPPASILELNHFSTAPCAAVRGRIACSQPDPIHHLIPSSPTT